MEQSSQVVVHMPRANTIKRTFSYGQDTAALLNAGCGEIFQAEKRHTVSDPGTVDVLQSVWLQMDNDVLQILAFKYTLTLLLWAFHWNVWHPTGRR